MKRLFRIQTVRAKLIASTMLVIAVVLAVLIVVVDHSARGLLMASIDRDLRARAESLAMRTGREDRRGPPMDRPLPPMGERGSRRPGPFTPPRVFIATGGVGAPVSDAFDPAAVTKAMRGEGGGYTDVVIDREPYRVYTATARRNGQIHAVVQATYPLFDVQQSLASLRMTLLTVVAPIGLVLAAVASLFVVGRLLRPVRKMAADAERIESGNLGERLSRSGDDEFSQLAGTLNRMLGRLQTSFEGERSVNRQLQEAIARQRQFTADASHELKTPLSVVKVNTGLILHGVEDPERTKASVRAIDQAADRMSALVSDLLTLAKADAGRMADVAEPVDLAESLAHARSLVPEPDRVTIEIEQGLVVQAGKEDLVKVWSNLIDNALRHSGSERVEVRATRREKSAVVEVADQGVGIAPEHLPRLFDRFYRPDESRTASTGGSGLGLAICRGIVEAYGGTITVESALGEGTTFRVELPLATS